MNYDYEILGYVVEYKIGDRVIKDKFGEEETAISFARNIYKFVDKIRVIKESYAVEWWD